MEWPPVTLLAMEGADGVAAASVRDQKSEYGLVAAWQFPDPRSSCERNGELENGMCLLGKADSVSKFNRSPGLQVRRGSSKGLSP